MLLHQFLIAHLINHNLTQLRCKSLCISLHRIRRKPFQMRRNSSKALNLTSNLIIALTSKNFKNLRTLIHLCQRERFQIRWQWNLCPIQFKLSHFRPQLYHLILLISIPLKTSNYLNTWPIQAASLPKHWPTYLCHHLHFLILRLQLLHLTLSSFLPKVSPYPSIHSNQRMFISTCCTLKQITHIINNPTTNIQRATTPAHRLSPNYSTHISNATR